MRQGRLRLEASDRLGSVAAASGLVMLLALLASLLFGEAWRGGKLILLSDREGFEFLPESFFPVALVALALAWLLLVWGAMNGSPRLAVIGAFGFLLLNSAIGRTLSIDIGHTISAQLVLAGYLGAPSVMLLSALLRWRAEASFERIRPYLLAMAALAVASLFGGQLLNYSAQLDQGTTITFPTLLGGTIVGISAVLHPLVFVAGLAVVEFGYDMAEAAAAPAWKLRPNVARTGLVLLLAVALWFQFFSSAGEWLDALSSRPSQLVGPIVAVLAFFWIARIGHRRRTDLATNEDAKEGLVYGSALALATPSLIVLLGILIGEFVLEQLRALELGQAIVDHVPVGWFHSWGEVLLWSGVLALGIYLAGQYRTNLERSEIGLGLILIAAWVLPFNILDIYGVGIPMSPPLMGVVAVVGVTVYSVANITTLDTRTAVRLGALSLFLWLLTSEGDFLAIVGKALHLPGSFVIVFGIAFTLLAGSSFAMSSSKHLPRRARTLMWVGYLVLTTVLLNWYELAHGSDPTERASSTAFFFLGIPIGVWMLMRRWFAPPAERGATQSG